MLQYCAIQAKHSSVVLPLQSCAPHAEYCSVVLHRLSPAESTCAAAACSQVVCWRGRHLPAQAASADRLQPPGQERSSASLPGCSSQCVPGAGPDREGQPSALVIDNSLTARCHLLTAKCNFLTAKCHSLTADSNKICDSQFQLRDSQFQLPDNQFQLSDIQL